MYRAKLTSKGQITIPVDVRTALHLGIGDGVVFELKGEYAVIKRQPTLDEALEAVHRILGKPTGPPRYPSDREAVAAHIRKGWERRELDDVAHFCRPGKCVSIVDGFALDDEPRDLEEANAGSETEQAGVSPKAAE